MARPLARGDSSGDSVADASGEYAMVMGVRWLPTSPSACACALDSTPPVCACDDHSGWYGRDA